MLKFPKAALSLVNQKVRGGALYIAVIISIIIGVILTLFILLSRYNQRTVTVYSQTSQLYQNLNSAFEIAKSDYFTEQSNNQWQKNSYNDDSIRIKKLQWGGYTIVVAETKNRHQNLSRAGMYGTHLNADTALLISDNGRPVGISGKVEFKSNVYFPKSGIKPAYIEGQSYIASSSNAGFLKSAPALAPQLNEKVKNSIIYLQKNIDPVNDSIVVALANSESVPFHKKTRVCEMAGSRLSNIHLKNNIKIICNGNLVIDSTCKFENILIICHKVKFSEGFKGSVHVIARDSIITAPKCQFQFPSSFVLSSTDDSPALKCILFEDDNKFSGGLVAFTDNPSGSQGKVFVKLNSKSEFTGLIYSSDYIHVEGKINGTIIANSLLLKTPSAVYENHLLGCEIDPKKYSHLLSVPVLFNKNNPTVCCKML